MIRRLGLLASGLLALGGLAIANGTFDGAPSAPLPFNQTADYLDYDVQVHSRNPDSWFVLPAVNAQHGADCSAPPVSHPNTSYEGSVYQCANHLMTSINGSAGYAEIILTPNRIVDFSTEQVIRFDMSTERMSQRDWVDFWITPWADNLALPIDSSVDLQGRPKNAVQVTIGGGSPELFVTVNNNTTNYGPYSYSERLISAGVTAGTNQSAVRQTFQITISPTRVKFERLASSTATAKTFINQTLSLPFTSGVFQIGHHSYTPFKDNAGVAGTWHFDNIDVPGTPFTILHGNERYTQGGTITFPAAPAGSYLRFSAVGTVSVNGSVVAAQKPIQWGAAANYFVPIAEGSTSAVIALSSFGSYSGPFIAKDFHIWSQTVVTPTPVPTNTPTNTATPTNTPVPTATPIPPTPTPALGTCVVTWNGTPVATHGAELQSVCEAR